MPTNTEPAEGGGQHVTVQAPPAPNSVAKMLTSVPRSEWTLETYAIYVEAQRAADERAHQQDLKFVEAQRVAIGALRDTQRELDEKLQEERDRRYTEVNIEKEKALKIKETADLAALSLAREIQDYKDRRGEDQLQSINAALAHFATGSDLRAVQDKFEIQLKPVTDYVFKQLGRTEGVGTSFKTIAGAIAATVGIVAIIGFAIKLVAG